MAPASRNGSRSNNRMWVSWWRSSQVLSSPGSLHKVVFRLADQIQRPLGQQIQRQRQPGQPVTQNAVVNIAAGGVVAGQRLRPLPGLASAAGILVVAIGQRLPPDQPKPLNEKKRQQTRRNALRKIELEAANPVQPKGHHV